MDRRRIVATLVGLLLVACALPAAAFPAEEGRLIRPYRDRFAGATKIESMGGFTSAQVRLPREAGISNDPFFNRHIKIDSKAGIAGISIRHATRSVELITIQMATCVEVPCRERPLSFTTTGSFDGDRELRLPAGDYIVTTFTDGPSMTATLKLEGLEGAETIPTYMPAEGKAGDIEPYINDNTVRPLYSAQSEQDLTGAGMVLIGLLVETPKAAQEGEIDACLSNRNGVADVPVPHSFVCLGGSTMVTFSSDEGRYAFMMHYELINEGEYTHSINYRGVTESTGARAFELVLDYQSGERDHFVGGTVFGGGN